MTLIEWLRTMDCGVYAKKFSANGINSIAEAMTLTDDRLKSMDVVSGHRQSLLERIAAMMADPVVASNDGMMKMGLMKRDRLADAMGTAYTTDGNGGYVNTAGNRYTGAFNDTGLFHGQGTYLYTNGENYVGSWEDGKRHGQGIMTYNDGRVVNGIWANNEPQ